MTHLYIIRHGQANAAVEGRVAGIKGDTGLSELGVEQATRLRDRLLATKEIKADVFIASDIPRARQTAEIIAPAIGLPPLIDEEVEELRPGEADGLYAQEYQDRYPQYWRDTSPFAPISSGGESWPEFVLRASRALARITTEYAGKTIVLVCHGGIIQSSFLYFFGSPIVLTPAIIEFETKNTSITHWERGNFYIKDPNITRWRLVCHNDDFHLRDPRLWRSADGQRGNVETEDTKQTSIAEKE